MILNNTINAGTFVYCSAFSSPHETLIAHLSGNGHYSQWTYVVSGEAHRIYSRDKDGVDIVAEFTASSDTLIDTSEYMGLFNIITTKDQHASVVNFNPLPADSKIKVDILHSGVHNIQISPFDTCILCISGSISVGGRELKALQHAKIRINTTINIPPYSVACVVISQRLRISSKG